MADKKFTEPYDQEPSAPISLPITYEKPFLGVSKIKLSNG